MDWLAFSHGAALCASLIVTIGAQNAFVLRQGIMRSHVGKFLLICTAGAREAPTGRVAFALGAMAVSAVWFVLLGYGARALAPLFRRATAWRVLDGAIGSMILLLAVMQLR